MKNIKNQFSKLNQIPVFEFEVIHSITKKTDHIVFNISIRGNNFRAEHFALNPQEEKSNKIAFKSIEIDEDFSLDENLQELYEECQNAILKSPWYNIK